MSSCAVFALPCHIESTAVKKKDKKPVVDYVGAPPSFVERYRPDGPGWIKYAPTGIPNDKLVDAFVDWYFGPEGMAWIRLHSILDSLDDDPVICRSSDVREFVGTLALAIAAKGTEPAAAIYAQIRAAFAVEASTAKRSTGDDNRARVEEFWLQDIVEGRPYRGRIKRVSAKACIPESTVRGVIKALIQMGQLDRPAPKRG